MSEEWDGMRRVIWSKDLDDMQVIGTDMFSVGVPVDADPEFKAYVFAAGVTHSLGNVSIDHLLRRNYDKWIRRHSDDLLFSKGSLSALLRDIRSLVDRRCDALSSCSLGPSAPTGKVAAANALIRLASTFRAAVQLVRLKLPFEAEAVVRLGFEQLGWAHAVVDLDSLESIDRVKATAAATTLKRIFPGAGRAYGRLSELAHMAPHTHCRVLVTRNDQLNIEIKSPEAARESALYLIILLDGLLTVSEICFGSFGPERQSVDIENSKLLENRPAAALIPEYLSILPADAAATFQQWWTGHVKG
jgi:hypothetical protein